MDDSLGIENGIYLDLDSLFDTRIGIIKQFDDIYDNLFNDDYYDKRLTDEFSYLNMELFKKLYKKRDNKVLKNSPVSNILSLFIKEADLLLTKRIESNSKPIIDITINTYPYHLTTREQETISFLLTKFSNIETLNFNYIRTNPFDISFKDVGIEYNVMFMYNSLTWIDYNISADNGNASNVRIYGIGLLLKPVLYSKDEDVTMIFKYQNELFSRYINYLPLPASHFNIRNAFRIKK